MTAMEFDFEELSAKIEKATRLAFRNIWRRHGTEGVHAFALYSDDGAMTVCVEANTLEHLKNADPDQLAYY